MRFEPAKQYVILMPGPDADLPPHIDYEATAVVYAMLHGTKTVHVWRPLPENIQALANAGSCTHQQLADRMKGERCKFEIKAGDPPLFIPPAWPHWVENSEGGSAAWGVNFACPASHAFE